MTEQEQQPSVEEIQAAYEEQLDKIHVGDVLAQTVFTLLNLAARRLGLLAGGEAGEAIDSQQAKQAIDGIRALLPLVEDHLGDEAAPVKDALSQLQLAYAQRAPGQAAVENENHGAQPQPGSEKQQTTDGPGPAQSSGRLWVPGQ